MHTWYGWPRFSSLFSCLYKHIQMYTNRNSQTTELSVCMDLHSLEFMVEKNNFMSQSPITIWLHWHSPKQTCMSLSHFLTIHVKLILKILILNDLPRTTPQDYGKYLFYLSATAASCGTVNVLQPFFSLWYWLSLRNNINEGNTTYMYKHV